MPPALPGSYLVLETTNRCSLQCVHCSVSEKGHPHHERVGMLPLRTVERLLDDLIAADGHFDSLVLFWLGEPLIHPEFAAIYQSCLRAAVDHRVFNRVEVHTNATHLDPGVLRVALNGATTPQTWHFSLDAATEATYRRIKGADRYAKVSAQVEAFLAERRRRQARWPRPVLQFIVSDQNEQEIEGFARHWEATCSRLGLATRRAAQHVPAGDDVVIFYRQLDCPTPDEQERQNAVFRKNMADIGLALPAPTRSPLSLAGHSTPCAAFWKSPVISWDGRVTTCTRDNRLENSLGSLWDTPFSELWWGSAMRAKRARVARGDYAGLSACAGCFVPRSANHPELSPAELAG